MNFTDKEVATETFDLKESLKSYSKNYKWFIISVIICVGIVYSYRRYEIPEYKVEASIKIVDPEGPSDVNVFQDLELFSNENGAQVEEDIFVLKSRTNLIEVVDQLNLNIRMFIVGQLKDTEIYNNRPIEINFMEPDSVINNSNESFYLRFSDNNSFGYGLAADKNFKPIQFGEKFSSLVGEVVIAPKIRDLNSLAGKIVRIEICSLSNEAQKYDEKISIYPDETGSRVVRIELEDPVLQKGKDIINTLLKVYTDNYTKDRKLLADQTSLFINERINGIYTELASVDETEEDFKSNRRLTDMTSQSSINLSESAASESQLRNATIQLNIASSMKNRLDNAEEYEVLPSNMGIENEAINETTAAFNALVLRRNRLLESSSESNPVVLDIDRQLESLKRSMSASLASVTDNLNLQTNSLSQRLSEINSKLYSTPGNTRALREITRKQETKEALYLYLLQKREESQIAFASTEPNLKIIDQAFSKQNSPKGSDPRVLYLGALLLGIFLPFSVIYTKDLLDTKIHNKVDLEKIFQDATILGELPKLSNKDSKLVREDDRSVLAESMRILRTNLYYVLKTKSKKTGKGKIVMVTSTVSNEGKTFLSSNLSILLAKANHKVLLVGSDIRNPRIKTFLTENQKHRSKDSNTRPKGLTEYLHNTDVDLKEIINSEVVSTSQIDIIYSGKIPPNPTELLMNERLGDLCESVAASYDYIVVDTAPLLGVTDTLLISKYADHIIYVTRAGKTDKKVLSYPIKLKKEGRLKNFSFVVNGVEEGYLGYGGIYGYGYDQSKKKRWFSRN